MHKGGSRTSTPATDSVDTTVADAEFAALAVEDGMVAERSSLPASLVSDQKATAEPKDSTKAHRAKKGEKMRGLSSSGSRWDISSAPTEIRNDSCDGTSSTTQRPIAFSSRLRQVAVQVAVLLSSWGFLALLQLTAHSLLLLIAISLSRLHLGWLVCCILRMLLSSRRQLSASDKNLKVSRKGRIAAAIRAARERCWSLLPLRYWHCVFYLALLLIAFWAASVVQEDTYEGLQSFQGGSGASLSPSHAWRGGTLSPLLLNSESPQHVKIAATAVAKGREASDKIFWLLHTAARQQYGKWSLLVRSAYMWLDSAILQPLSVLLSRAGFLASVNVTCNASDAPQAAADDSWWWVVWSRSAVQTAVRHLPSAARSFLCGDSSSTNGLNSGGALPQWLEKTSEMGLEFEAGQNAIEAGPYCFALLLLLIYALSTALQRLCLSIPLALKHVFTASGSVVSGLTPGEWMDPLFAARTGAATSFAVTFVILFLFYTAVAAASRAIAVLASLGLALINKAWPAFNSGSNNTPPADSILSTGDNSRGAVGLEILAAAITCWLLLLADRNFVMFAWGTMQPLRLSVLSAVLLLRLPSAQVATLLSWPPPLREPALQLQRSQPLRIIDPVAVGSMLGCIFGAVTLSLTWRAAAQLFLFLKRTFFSCSATPVECSLQPLGCSRGSWASRINPVGRDSPTSLWQQLQEQSEKISELQKLLRDEQSKVTLREQFIEQLHAKLQMRPDAEHSEGLATNRLQQQQKEPQSDLVSTPSAANKALSEEGKLHEDVARQEDAHQHGALTKRQQATEQQQPYCAEEGADLRCEQNGVQPKPRDIQGQLHDLQKRSASETRKQLQKPMADEFRNCHQRLYAYRQKKNSWKQESRKTVAQLTKLQVEVKSLAARLENVTKSRDELQQQLQEATKRVCNSDCNAEIVDKNEHLEAMAAKDDQIKALRESLEPLRHCKNETECLLHSQESLEAEHQKAVSHEHGRSYADGPTCNLQGLAAHKWLNQPWPPQDSVQESGTEQCSSMSLGGQHILTSTLLKRVFDSTQQRKLRKGLAEHIQDFEKLSEVTETDIYTNHFDQHTLEKGWNTSTMKSCRKATETDTSNILNFIESSTRKLNQCMDQDEQRCRDRIRAMSKTGSVLHTSVSKVLSLPMSTGIFGSGDSENQHTVGSGYSFSQEGSTLLSASTSAKKLSVSQISFYPPWKRSALWFAMREPGRFIVCRRCSLYGTSCSWCCIGVFIQSKGQDVALESRSQKELLTKAEADRLYDTLKLNDQCTFFLKEILKDCKLPKQVVDTASKLPAADGNTDLEGVLRRRSKSCRSLDVDTLRLLISAWPSEEFCNRLLQHRQKADTLSIQEQKFLPFAEIRHGCQRLKLLCFLVELDLEWKEEQSRLEGLKDALGRLLQSETLKLLHASCAEIHKEMRMLSCNGNFSDTAAAGRDKEPQNIPQPCQSNSQMWKTEEELRSALDKFNVWNENGDFNMGCLKVAAGIFPSNLKKGSLLHEILRQLRPREHVEHQLCPQTVQERCGDDTQDMDLQQQRAYQLDIPQKLAKELHLDSSSVGKSDVDETFPPLKPQLNGPADVCRCSCSVCNELPFVRSGLLGKWREQRKAIMEEQKAMMEQQIFEDISKESYDSMSRGILTQRINGEAENSEKNKALDSELLEDAMVIADVYCDSLNLMQHDVADLAKQIREQFKNQHHAREMQENAVCEARSSESPQPTSTSATSSEAVRAELPAFTKSLALPPAKAGSSPGDGSTGAEPCLEIAWQLVESVHAAVGLIKDTWCGLVNKDRGNGLTVDHGSLHSQRARQAQDKTANPKIVATPFLPSADCEAASCSVILAKTAAIAATAAAAAQEVLKGAEDGAPATRTMTKPCSVHNPALVETSVLEQQQHLANHESKSLNGSGIPCPTRQGSPTQLFCNGHNRELTTRLILSNPTNRSGTSVSSSTSASQAPGSKESLNRQWQGKGTVATARRWNTITSTFAPQQQGHFDSSIQSAAALRSQKPRLAAALKTSERVSAKEDSWRQRTVTSGKQTRTAGFRRVHDATASDICRAFATPTELNALSAASAGATTRSKFPQLATADSAAPSPNDMAGKSISECGSQASRVPGSEKRLAKAEGGQGVLGDSTALRSEQICRANQSGLSFPSFMCIPTPAETDVSEKIAAFAASRQAGGFGNIFTAQDSMASNSLNRAASNGETSSCSANISDGNVLNVGDE